MDEFGTDGVMLAKIGSLRIMHLAARKRFQRLTSPTIPLSGRDNTLDDGTCAMQKIWRYNDEKRNWQIGTGLIAFCKPHIEPLQAI
jgi:hypothetical protein